jgi:DNA-directed RNA polymerase subunit RPC12/RpoP
MVVCRTCGEEFYLTGYEAQRWSVCPHCAGWWVLDDDRPTR